LKKDLFSAAFGKLSKLKFFLFKLKFDFKVLILRKIV
jgi:hypothetical protein